MRDVRPPDPLEPESHEQYSQFETLALPRRGLGPVPARAVLEVGLYRVILTSDRILGPVPAAQTAVCKINRR